MTPQQKIKTKAQALAEARTRWGADARIEYWRRVEVGGRPLTDPKTGRELARKWRCQVGVVTFLGVFEIRGQGDTWDAAFKEADAGGLTWPARST